MRRIGSIVALGLLASVASGEEFTVSSSRSPGYQVTTLYLDGEIYQIHRQQVGRLLTSTVLGSDRGIGRAWAYDWQSGGHTYVQGESSGSEAAKTLTLLETLRIDRQLQDDRLELDLDLDRYHIHYRGCEHDDGE